ncbi:NAD(P)-dependent oxidoreductase [Pseudochelatococcus sp. B33]
MALRVTVIAGGVLDPGTAPATTHDLTFVPLSDPGALRRSLVEADAFVTRQVAVTDELLSVCKRLRLVQQVGAGINRIDLAAAGARGIPVANTPGAPTIAVVEHMFLLILAALRDLPGQLDAMRSGVWSDTVVWENDEIAGRTVGLIGYGSIGRAFAARMLAFDARMLVTTRTVPDDTPQGIRFVDLDTLLRDSEILVVAVPLTQETKGMIGAKELAKMQPSALFVNVGRGAIVDEAALYEALANNRLRGAALDVFTQEPLPLDSPFRKLPNVILTPHSGGSTKHARRRIWTAAMDNLDRLAGGRELINIVNARELSAARR